MQLSDPITIVPGIGDSYAKRLAKIDIVTINDLLDHFPRTHLDYSKTTKIENIRPNEPVCIKAIVTNFNSVKLRGKLTLQKATIADQTGQISITWFNQEYLKDSLKIDQEYFFTGAADLFKNKLMLNAPDFEPVKIEQVHTKRIIPIYPLTHGITQKWLRHKIHLAISSTKIPEIINLPDFLDLNTAYHQIHFPTSQKLLKQAKLRLAFNDLLAIHLKSALTKKDWQNHSSTPIKIERPLHQQLLQSLPYQLAQDQNTAIDKIFVDISQNKPMNRLLQGDVGTGKTIIAIAAALQVVHQGASVIIMAPTQVLAGQHHLTFSKILKPFKIKPLSITSNKKSQILKRKPSIYIGTHALLHQSKLENNIGLVIIDEQHRFGVYQRSHFS